MTVATSEERVATLEHGLQQIERRQQPEAPPDAPRGWQRLVGVFPDSPEFEAAVRLGREWRQSEDARGGEVEP